MATKTKASGKVGVLGTVKSFCYVGAFSADEKAATPVRRGGGHIYAITFDDDTVVEIDNTVSHELRSTSNSHGYGGALEGGQVHKAPDGTLSWVRDPNPAGHHLDEDTPERSA